MEDTGNIQEMLRDAEEATEAKVVIEGSTDGIEQKVTAVTSAGYSFIYDTVTGDRSKTNNNMLPAQLKKKRADGTLRFTMDAPKFTPKRGEYKCLLHTSNENRKHYDSMGLPVCKKHNLTSPFQVRRHMEKRHKVEWAAIEQERIDREKQEDRDFQRSVITMAKEKAPLYVSKKDKKKE